MAMLSNVGLSLIGMLILIVSGYLISTFFDLEMAYYMPYLLWLLGLCVFNMFLDKSHVNIYTKKMNPVGDENEEKRAVETTSAPAKTPTTGPRTETQENLMWAKWNKSYI